MDRDLMGFQANKARRGNGIRNRLKMQMEQELTWTYRGLNLPSGKTNIVFAGDVIFSRYTPDLGLVVLTANASSSDVL